jgi:3',5'-cyclic AMP phosphodiesterase CpdA
MPTSLRLAFTADLHWGHNRRGDEATLALVQAMRENPPDGFILAGDAGTADHFDECLQLFAELPCHKAMVPGNHDIWVEDNDPRGDSLTVYRQVLPALCDVHGFRYLDHGPAFFDEVGLAVVGTMNWYDYSWSLERLKREVPDWEWRLRTKTFTRGRHNDGRFVRWPLDDVTFTQQLVTAFADQLQEALTRAGKVIAVTHHPAFYGLSFPREAPASGVDSLLWDALSGNALLESLLLKHADHIPVVVSGHTHRERENQFGPVRGYNIGGDYHFKRLLVLHWPELHVETYIFGNPAGPRF